MSASTRDLSRILAGSLLESRDIAEVPVLNTGEMAYAIQISSAEVESAWRIARGLLPRTQRWPVATTFWAAADGSTWTDRVLEADFFSRFYYEEAPNPVDVSPRALCARANAINLPEFLALKAARRAEGSNLEETMAYELEETKTRCGSAPNRSELKAAQVSTERDLEHFLLDWEHSHGVSIDPNDSRQQWFEQNPSALLFLPTPNGWDTLAYLHWFGTSDYGAENYIALGQSWEKKFGAELVAHYGTMLQCLVSRPPTTVQDAWELACEHDLAGGCTLALPCIRLRDYARALVGWDRWFLHERP
jgi:hypothetical protein